MPYQAVMNMKAGNVLVLAPHPDDEVFGCAGAIMRHVEAKDPVHVVVVTDGGHMNSARTEEYIHIRKQESIQAGVLLGYVPEFWGMHDRKIQYGEKLIARISDTMRSLDIDVVYAPSVSEMHPDHRVLGMAVAEAVRRSDKKITAVFYEIGIPLRPNCLLDISNLVTRKQQAMACFPSQLKQQQYDEQITALNRFRSYTLPESVTSAEAYFVTNSEELRENPLSLYHPESEKINIPGLEIEVSNSALVTVMIRSMDRGSLLQEALDSVALQTYPNIEVLIINAKGSEHSQQGDWCGRFPLRMCGSAEPLSRSKAANLALKEATGDFLIFLDDDDLLYPGHIALLMQKLESRPGSQVAYSGVTTLGGEGTCAMATFNSPYNALMLLVGNYIPIHAVLFNRCFVDSGCHFDENMDIYEDWDFWIQLSQQTKFVHVDQVSAQYRILDGGSEVQLNSDATNAARLYIYNKWKNRWSDKDLLGLMQSVYEKEKLEEEFSAKEASLNSVSAELQVKEALFERINAKIEMNEATINNLKDYLKERDSTIAGLQESAGDLHIALHDKHAELACLKNELAKKEVSLVQKEASIVVFQEEVKRRGDEIQRRGEEMSRFLNSKSWRLTAGFRMGYRVFVTKPAGLLRQQTSNVMRTLWSFMPVSIERKLAVKRGLFKSLPILFRHTLAYQNWQGSTARRSAVARGNEVPVISTRSLLDNNPQEHIPLLDAAPFTSRSIRLIAFYLPQFHPIAENNEWWGEGFTEWTNVRPAEPQFVGHYQPHVPGELGYYDLCENVDTQQRQIELAKLYGLEGFCFYFYWFDGKRLLEDPVKKYLNDKSLDLPFCLCWANENWSRRWDGLDSEILIGQNHSAEDDLAFIEYVSKYMLDERYIRINNKPLLLVYRPGLLPSAKKTSERWRQWCRDAGIGEIYLAYTQSFEAVNPKKYGFDAAIEFPPNRAGVQPLAMNDLDILNDDFSGVLYDLGAVAERSRNYTTPDYTLFRGVCPSWDNTARRKGNGTIFVNSSPVVYQQWLYNAALDTAARFNQKDESLVFVNAWNEWAEGAHLEPDQGYGYAYLQATRDALAQADWFDQSHAKVVVVSHDAHPHGAQFLALGMVRSLSIELKMQVEVVLLGQGRLKADFMDLAPVHEINRAEAATAKGITLAENLASRGFELAIVNTTVSGDFCKVLSKSGIACVTLVHELPGVLKEFGLEKQVQEVASFSDCIVFPAQQVAAGYEQLVSLPSEKTRIRPQGLWRRNLSRFKREEARLELRLRLGVEADAPVVLAVAFADRRKGIDLFVKSCLRVLDQRQDAVFVWIGHWHSEMRTKVDAMLAGTGNADAFHFVGYEPETSVYHAGADIYALTSREDPFPNVVIESFDAGVPVVAFEGSGGGAELVSKVGGIVVPMEDTTRFATALLDLMANPAERNQLGNDACVFADQSLAFKSYLFDLCSYGGLEIPKISVIVPNYNYAQFIRGRLNSIVNQSLPIYELIILDDASTDNSVATILDWLKETKIEARFVSNENNSGNVFLQWAKGLSLATGDFVWIAEADDLCTVDFLQAVMPAFDDNQVVLSYCESQQIDEAGRNVNDDYREYLNDICQEKWNSSYVADGEQEICHSLAIKNSIPNVSGAVFRREMLDEVVQSHIEEISGYRFAGDWLVYVYLLEKGKVSFSPNNANIHRRHTSSVVKSGKMESVLGEIESMQKMISGRYELNPEVVSKAEIYLTFIRSYMEKNG